MVQRGSSGGQVWVPLPADLKSQRLLRTGAENTSQKWLSGGQLRGFC